MGVARILLTRLRCCVGYVGLADFCHCDSRQPPTPMNLQSQISDCGLQYPPFKSVYAGKGGQHKLQQRRRVGERAGRTDRASGEYRAQPTQGKPGTVTGRRRPRNKDTRAAAEVQTRERTDR